MSRSVNDWHEMLPFFNSELFHDVQQSRMFADSKTFADATPLVKVSALLDAYAQQKTQADFSLEQFVQTHFRLPQPVAITSDETCDSVAAFIDHMWNVLTQQPAVQTDSSLIPLAKPYIVPGGRFREIYYWDSYFTALGLVGTEHQPRVRDMLENFLAIQQEVGCIPNGNRAYYHTRSQPPVLGLMANLVLQYDHDDELARRCLQGMEAEYQFWMQGSAELTVSEPAHRRVIRMPDGSVLNRYFDDAAAPRPESYHEDIDAAQHLEPGARFAFYRHLRAACESGWDFSSRWLADADDLTSIHTTDIVPVDLNCLLYLLECQLRDGYKALNNTLSGFYAERAQAREMAIQTYLWDANSGLFRDFDVTTGMQTTVDSLATVMPLFVGLAKPHQADGIARRLGNDFLKPGGLVTTLNDTAQQWDSPNGWAPLQWLAVKGLEDYGHTALAARIRSAWLGNVEAYFNGHHAMLEKYNVCQPGLTASGGEYEVQLGFGWTNGVVTKFYQMENE